MTDLALPPVRPGFRFGLTSVFRGIGWVVTSPAVWPLAFVPMLVALVIMVGLGVTTVYLVPGWVGGWLGPASSLAASILHTVVQVLAVMLGFVVSILAAFALAQPFSGPALESLVRKQEQALGAPVRPGNNFVVDVWRSLQSLLVGYSIGLPILAVLALASFLFPPAAVALVPLKLVVASFTVAWDLCDYPLSIRGLRVADRLAIMVRYKSAVFGFGIALALAGLVPGLLFLLLPCGVAGAARVVWEIERFERSEGRALGGASPAALPPP